MTDITLTSQITVRLIDSMASDEAVTRAARVSVVGENDQPEGKFFAGVGDTPEEQWADSKAKADEYLAAERKKEGGLINYLMANRHGSPFEHNAFTFFVKAPIFVFREWHRHRIASINEMSGRYTKLRPLFYTPDSKRKLINVGTSARPEFAPGDPGDLLFVQEGDRAVAQLAWDTYEARLESGIANEIARTVLPVSVYSEMYWTVNARSLMNFLSLRTDSPDAAVRSRPQREIELGAEQIEWYFAKKMPITHAAFVKNGRVAP